MSNLKLQVILSAVDKMTAPFKNASKEVSKLSNTLKKTQSELKNFEKVQNILDSFSNNYLMIINKGVGGVHAFIILDG